MDTGGGDEVLGALSSVWSDTLGIANLLDGSEEVIYFKDVESRFLRVSRGCGILHRLAPEQLLGLTDNDLFAAEHAEAARADEIRIMRTGVPILNQEERESWHGRPDSWVASSKFPLRSADGTVVGTFGISRDVTARVLAQQELRRVEAQLRTVLEASTDQIATYDTQLRYRYVNPAGQRAHGVGYAELIGRTDRECGMSRDTLDVWVPALERAVGTAEPGELEFSVDTSNGNRWYHTRLSPDLDANGELVGVIASTRDITALKVAEQELAHRATHDALTGLANRRLLVDRAARGLAHVGGAGRLGVLFADVDEFKEINDRYGHDVGDRVLVELADRLAGLARRDDTVARLGGDEFVMLCDGIPNDAVLQQLAHRVTAALAAPFEHAGVRLPLSVSVGAAFADEPGMSPADLLSRADTAMYRVKREHHAQVVAGS